MTGSLQAICHGYSCSEADDMNQFYHIKQELRAFILFSWVVMSCSPGGGYQYCGGAYYLHLLKREVEYSSETLVSNSKATGRHNSEDHICLL
jgi:hypothetical protein